MFRIEAFVDDKRLAEALRALVGIVRDQPKVMPVVNVEEGGTGAPKAITNGSLLALFEAWIAKNSDKQNLAPEDVRKWLKSQGKSPASSTYLVKKAIAHHLLRAVGKSASTRYIIINRKKG